MPSLYVLLRNLACICVHDLSFENFVVFIVYMYITFEFSFLVLLAV